MPEVSPTRNEVYLCTGVDIGTDNRFWITGFNPKMVPGTVHHMAVAGCSERPPKTDHNVWNCGANGNPVLEPQYPSFVTCADGDQFTSTLFLWSKNGAPYMLPENTGFPVGGDTKFQYLVLQVHYINIERLHGPVDTAGVDLTYTEVEPEKSAGMLSVHVRTNVPALSKTYQDGGCKIGENKILHPFSYLVHTHALGQVVSAWRLRRGERFVGIDEWKLIGKKSPQSPQSFYPVADPAMRLVLGDQMALRCTMLNMRSTDVIQGLASYDEMCDLYMMYWVWGNHTKLLEGNTYCTSSGPPRTTWEALGFNNIPETRATTL